MGAAVISPKRPEPAISLEMTEFHIPSYAPVVPDMHDVANPPGMHIGIGICPAMPELQLLAALPGMQGT